MIITVIATTFLGQYSGSFKTVILSVKGRVDVTPRLLAASQGGFYQMTNPCRASGMSSVYLESSTPSGCDINRQTQGSRDKVVIHVLYRENQETR